MKLETRYYIAKRNEDGLIKKVHEEIGPYYDNIVLINQDGYKTREDAFAAVEGYIKAYKERYDWAPRYIFIILEEFIMSND